MIRASDMLAAFREAPFCSIETITDGGPILVLAPHPDDESLGFGGMIATAVEQDSVVHVAILTDGTGSHPGSRSYPPERLRYLRESETCAALAELGVGVGQITFMAQPDTRAPTAGPAFDALVNRLAEMVAALHVRSLLTTWRHDPHCDHEAAALLGGAVARATGVRLWMVPVWGWTLANDHSLPDPIPVAMRLQIAAQLPAKRRAIAAHVSQTTALIDDCADGFRLQPEFLALFDRPWEVCIAA